MTDSRDNENTAEAAPVDFDRLESITERFSNDSRFGEIDWQPGYAPEKVVCKFDPGYYPETVEDARLEIIWFENNDFSIHYHESHRLGAFDHRWDRHPSDHNAGDHIHPGPDSPTPGRDATHSEDWRDVLSTVLSEVESRQRSFWEK